MGVSLMLRWGKGSVVLTCTGARGAPITPSNSLRSDLLYAAEVTDGVLDSCPFIQCPKPKPLRFDSPISLPSGSGPSINGVKVSPTTGLKLPDLEISGSGFATYWLWLCFLLRNSPDIGDPALPGLFARDLAGESPLTTSSFNAAKNPCFRSITNTNPDPNCNKYESKVKSKRVVNRRRESRVRRMWMWALHRESQQWWTGFREREGEWWRVWFWRETGERDSGFRMILEREKVRWPIFERERVQESLHDGDREIFTRMQRAWGMHVFTMIRCSSLLGWLYGMEGPPYTILSTNQNKTPVKIL